VPAVEYEVPRALDVPDRLGVPFFTTVQFLVLVAAVILTVALFKAPAWLVPAGVKPWLVVWLPALAFWLPRSLGGGWTVYRVGVSRVGRWLRPRRTIWRP
jgi:hypothetical protein